MFTRRHFEPECATQKAPGLDTREAEKTLERIAICLNFY